MSVQPVSEGVSLTGSKTMPALPQRPPFARQIRDLFWFVALIFRSAPRAAALFGGAALAAGLATPLQLWSTRGLVDSLAAYAGGGPTPGPASNGVTPWAWLAIVVGALLLEQVLRGYDPLLRVDVRERVGPELLGRAMRKSCRLSLAAFEDETYYDRLSRVMTDVEGRGPALLSDIADVARAVPPLLSYSLVLALYAPLLLLITLIAMLPAVFEYLTAGKTSWNLLSEQTRERRLADYYADTMSRRENAKEVRLYGLSEYLLDRWSRLFWQTRNEQRRLALKLGFRQRGLVLFATSVSMLGLWWVVYAGKIEATPGEYALVFTSIGGVWGVANALHTLKSVAQTAGYASEFRAFMELPEEIGQEESPVSAKPNPKSGNGARLMRPFPVPLREGIRFEGVWFTYPNSGKPALAGVNLEIRAGEKVALVGENGAGKSTLAKLLLGLYRPDRGRITFDGVDQEEIDPHSMRQAASAVFQHFVQYQLTLRENIGLARPERMEEFERISEAAARSGADEIAGRLERGYETLLGPDVGGTELSGGQWQRVALARAFFREAQVLVLDEPTAALDPKAELAVFRRFVELVRGRTALLISHRLGMARLADRVVVLRDGQVIESGPHEALVQRDGEYAALFEAQARWYR